MAHKEISPPMVTSVLTFICFTFFYILGRLRDLFTRKQAKKGYAPLREQREDFYQRRIFTRLRDCWNRPIASAPDAWIDVMERSNLHRTSGFRPLELLGTTQRCLNLGSYNYLGFAASDKWCTPRVQATMQELGVSTCSSRADAGTTPIHQELEALVADFVGCEAAITFGMGYATNSATIPVLVGKGCLIISDALNHASIIAGSRASGAKIKVFRHNDPDHLDAVLRNSIAQGQPRTHRPWKKILIIVEGIYSMEGEVARLRDIMAIKKKYGAYLFLDEAHSIGALGKSGRGACEHWGVDPREVDIMMGTFTKSFGSCGGYIAGSRALIDYLRATSPAHLYATAMSAPAVQQVSSAIRLLNGEDGTTRGRDKIAQLHDNANYARRRMLDMGLHVLGDWDSPVMPLMIYLPSKMPAFSRLCMAMNVAVVVVGFPATALLLTRARICISAAHTPEDLEYGLKVLEHVCNVCMMRYGRYTELEEVAPHPTNPGSEPPPGATFVGQRSAGYRPPAPQVAAGKAAHKQLPAPQSASTTDEEGSWSDTQGSRGGGPGSPLSHRSEASGDRSDGEEVQAAAPAAVPKAAASKPRRKAGVKQAALATATAIQAGKAAVVETKPWVSAAAGPAADLDAGVVAVIEDEAGWMPASRAGGGKGARAARASAGAKRGGLQDVLRLPVDGVQGLPVMQRAGMPPGPAVAMVHVAQAATLAWQRLGSRGAVECCRQRPPWLATTRTCAGLVQCPLGIMEFQFAS